MFLSKAYLSSPSQADEVIQRFERYAKLEPQNALAQYYYAVSLWKGKRSEATSIDYPKVESLLKRAIALDGTLAEAHLQLGILYADQREYAKSLPEYTRAIALNPIWRTRITGWASTMCTPGKRRRRSRSSRPSSNCRRITRQRWTRSALRSGSLCIRRHRVRRQRAPDEQVRRSLDVCCDSIACLAIGRWLSRFGCWWCTRRCGDRFGSRCWVQPMQAAAAQMSAADTAKLREALAAYDQGRAAEAQPVLEELRRRHPANFDINETLGLIHAEAGDLTRALPLLEEAARLEPRSAIARGNLGAAYLKLNQPQKAVAELEAAARLLPSDQPAETNLAHAYMETGEACTGGAGVCRSRGAGAAGCGHYARSRAGAVREQRCCGREAGAGCNSAAEPQRRYGRAGRRGRGAAGRLSAGGGAFFAGRAPESKRAEHLRVGGGAAAAFFVAAGGEDCRLRHCSGIRRARG